MHAARSDELQNVTHRDLKLENLVLKRKGDLGSPVIVDFGLAKAARARDKMEVCERCAVGLTQHTWRGDATRCM